MPHNWAMYKPERTAEKSQNEKLKKGNWRQWPIKEGREMPMKEAAVKM